MWYVRSEEDLEQGVVGLELGQLVVVPRGALLEDGLVLGPAEAEPDEALSRGGVELLGCVQEDDVLVLWVDDDLQQDADVDCMAGGVREEGEVRM